jgi:hypothetical protein
MSYVKQYLDEIIDNVIDNIEKATPVIPEIIFIVPYRDRKPHRMVFTSVMPKIVEDLNCKILFCHQRDNRPFNRGAMKNIGFLYVKKTYPDNYKDITLVFHDIDSMSWYKGQFSYKTTKGIINHFYGFKFALGGIFSIKAFDFEDVNGFPNYWTWGLEDNVLLKRLLIKNKKIKYDNFVECQKDNKNIIGLWHGWDRLINDDLKKRADFRIKGMIEGINKLENIDYSVDIIDNLFIELNIMKFDTGETTKSSYVKNAKNINARYAGNNGVRKTKRTFGRGSGKNFFLL